MSDQTFLTLTLPIERLSTASSPAGGGREMGEELLPGLVKVIEERMGRVGRPFTTVIVIAAG